MVQSISDSQYCLELQQVVIAITLVYNPSVSISHKDEDGDRIDD